jgi:hypothetical protein
LNVAHVGRLVAQAADRESQNESMELFCLWKNVNKKILLFIKNTTKTEVTMYGLAGWVPTVRTLLNSSQGDILL